MRDIARIIAPAVAILAGVLVSGAAAPPAVAGSEIRVDLLRNGIGVPPRDFQFGQTGGGPDGKWAVVRDAEARQGAVLEQYSTDPYEGRLPLAIYVGESFKNVVATVRFKLLESTTRSAGIVVRLVTAGDYYVAVANALEGRVDLFRYTDGCRTRIAGVEAVVTRRQWQTLQLAANESRFSVSLDGAHLFNAYDSVLLDVGAVALWTEEDNVTRFDDLAIAPLGPT